MEVGKSASWWRLSRWPMMSFGYGLKAFWRQIRRWQQLARERRQLARLDDLALKDMGFSRADALQESQRPFWDDPLK